MLTSPFVVLLYHTSANGRQWWQWLRCLVSAWQCICSSRRRGWQRDNNNNSCNDVAVFLLFCSENRHGRHSLVSAEERSVIMRGQKSLMSFYSLLVVKSEGVVPQNWCWCPAKKISLSRVDATRWMQCSGCTTARRQLSQFECLQEFHDLKPRPHRGHVFQLSARTHMPYI